MNNIHIKCDTFLTKLGIILWKLRYIVVINNRTSETFWIYPRFLLISLSDLSLEDPFIKDIIQIMSLEMKDIFLLIATQIEMLIVPKNFFCHCWWIGIDVLYDFRGICFSTPTLSILKSNIEEKKKFWSFIRQVVYGC